MEIKLREVLVSDRRNAKTIDKIISNVRTIHYQLGLEGPMANLDFLHDYEAVRRAMSSYTLRSFKTYVGSAVAALEAVGDQEATNVYKQKLKELRAVIDAEDNTNIATEKQESKMVDFVDLVKARDELGKCIDTRPRPLNKKQYQDVQAYMLLCIATMCDTIMRNQELCKMVVAQEIHPDSPKDRNYYLPNYNLMHIYQYKTAHVYGRQVILLSDELNTILKDCLAMRPACYPVSQEYPIMINENGNPLTEAGGLQRLYERAGLAGVSPTIVRNIIATYRSGPILEQAKQIIKNSKDFGHSVVQHLRYIRHKKPEI